MGIPLDLLRLDTFAAQVRDGLAGADWLARREIIRALVKRVEVGEAEVREMHKLQLGT